MSKLKGRPLNAEEADELLRNWSVPNMAPDERSFGDRSTAFGTPLSDLYKKEMAEEVPVEEPQEPELPSITMAELERIRQDAYEEGLKQGHEQGYIDGFDKGVTEGKEAGYKEGLELGKTQGHEDVKPLIEEQLTGLRSILDNLTTPLNKVDEQVEKQLVQLTVMLAEAIIYQEVKTSPDVILHTLKLSIDSLNAEQEKVRIHLHPEDLELIKNSYGEQTIADNNWQLIAEPTLERGGCEVKTAQSSLDMTLKTRVKETLDSFLHNSGI
ncbi:MULTISPECIES: flagellar assembly protein FliH [Pseudoalteromonas]|uniref:flagellar assembly protein FliH n=1 Tax=Pseudoalteromonas TaxID=53246 RepID=UPI0002AA867E|nr:MULTISPECIES: flagellar assembly protein FliH [unclassified Pseudoalteromonas]ALQ08958.1 flagellar assembly protein FliH [Pseudoalteromonas sp. Bsw20308]ATG76853.1 flagellar assembly protein FliH [Pseudoalteromonas sp. 1_2015MBL_MicDiv]KDC53845.1 flagellar assembly protein FliH [Pseudoalteromonas sp. S3431]MDQ2043015.1 flagellar assembly protein FliH [Pseudoalteromonas sp. 20-92]